MPLDLSSLAEPELFFGPPPLDRVYVRGSSMDRSWDGTEGLLLVLGGGCTGTEGAEGGALDAGGKGGGGGGDAVGDERSPIALRAACRAIDDGEASLAAGEPLGGTGGGGGGGVALAGGSLGAAADGGGGGGAGGAGAGIAGAVAEEGGSKGRCGIGMDGFRDVTGGGGGLPNGVGRRGIEDAVGSDGRCAGLGGICPDFKGGIEERECGVGLSSGSFGAPAGLVTGGTGALGADNLDVSGSDRYDASELANAYGVSIESGSIYICLQRAALTSSVYPSACLSEFWNSSG